MYIYLCTKNPAKHDLRNFEENCKENPGMRAIAQILQAQANEHPSKFCEKIEQRPNYAST